ncbi:MAG: response regulator [Bacteriovoracaceae bacterium]
MAKNNKPAILIADDKESFREIIGFFIKAHMNCSLFFAGDGAEAIAVLQQRSIDLVFCDYHMPRKSGEDVYQYILEKELPSRFVLCSSKRPRELPLFFKESPPYATIEKVEMKEEIAEVLYRFKKDFFSGTQNAQGQTTSSVRTRFLLQLGKLPMDIFIEIPGKDPVRVFHKGECFDEADVIRFKQKGLQELSFFKKDEPLVYEAIAKKIAKLKQGPENQTFTQSQILDLLVASTREFGVRPELSSHLKNHFQEVLKQVELEKDFNLLLRKILKRKMSYLGKHSLMLANFSALLATDLGWDLKAAGPSLVIASLMHDVFLDTDIIDETGLLLNKSYDQDFLEHPQKAAELTERIESIPKDVPRIILEQHEIGFPFGVPATSSPSSVSSLGLLFSFSHLIVDSIISLNAKNKLNNQNFHNLMKQYSEQSDGYKRFFRAIKDKNYFSF